MENPKANKKPTGKTTAGKIIDEHILYDYTRDKRFESKMSKLIIFALVLLISLMIVAIAVICISNQKTLERMANHNAQLIVDFMSEYEFETSIDVMTNHNSFAAGNVSITR